MFGCNSLLVAKVVAVETKSLQLNFFNLYFIKRIIFASEIYIKQ